MVNYDVCFNFEEDLNDLDDYKTTLEDRFDISSVDHLWEAHE